MTKFGQVIAYDSNTRMATIAYSRPEACEKCGGCGSSTHKGSVILQADCAPGNWVRLELPESRFLQATALAYGIPFAGFMGGLLLGFWLFKQEIFAAITALLGLGISFGVLRLIDRRIRNRQDWSAQVTQVFDEKPGLAEIGCYTDAL